MRSSSTGGFRRGWLLVAGPLFQAAVELSNEE